MPRPIVLVVCDGWGFAPPSPGNAITRATTPVFDRWLARYPWTLLSASGEDVGLPAGLMGNSEVGHLTLGAGRMVPQDLLRIDLALRDGSFFENRVLLAAIDRAARDGTTLHLFGLLSDGGVHSHERHLFGLLELARRQGLERVAIHAFTDGRDTPPRSAKIYLDRLQQATARFTGSVATVSGRYYAMDRDSRWDRVAKAYAAIAHAEGLRAASALEAVEAAYGRGEDDEFIVPTVIESGAPGIRPGDAGIFFNFRADRARQIGAALAVPGFAEFPRSEAPPLPDLVCFTQYKKELSLPVAFPSKPPKRILAPVWEEAGAANLRLAETEKYAHVTYFFNGGVEQPFGGEERRLIPSWRGGATYDLHPQMSAEEITAAAEESIQAGRHAVMVINYANADMVGHTGKLEETIRAIEVLDGCLGRLEAAVHRAGGLLLMTADHGNAEQMIDPETGAPHTAHTTNPVPFVLCREGDSVSRREGSTLADVAPTLLGLQGIPVPKEMTGRDLRGT
ncbi:MAG TPA: 2,3-bisphosphoglycerate-independent phosphoglycerate mutase [Thermoanaerobaculia bacterium]